jgi:anti-anti-sigma factor
MAPEPHGAHLETQTLGYLTTVRLLGREVALHEELAQEVGAELLDLAEGKAGHTLVVSLGNVAFLTSTVLAKLTALHKRLQAGGGHLVLCDISSKLNEPFRVTRLDLVLDVRPSETLETIAARSAGPGGKPGSES